MRKALVHRLGVLLRLVLGAAVFASCSQEKPAGPIQVRLIVPQPGHCQYAIEPAWIQTLDSLTEMRGAVGQVVVSDENLNSRPEILSQFDSLEPVTTQFARSNDVFVPLDLDSLFSASLYYAIETGHLLFTRLDTSSDQTELSANMTQLVPNFATITKIVYDARRTFGEVEDSDEVTDNAEYYSEKISSGVTLNYFFAFPTDTTTGIPLGLNVGIMVHEYTHLVMHYLFWVPGIGKGMMVSDDKPTDNTLAALEEGLADYFGFLATGDPGFFLCSDPLENRDLSVPKSFDDSDINALANDEDYDIHEGGAVFAAINYEIGNALGTQGHEINGRLLVRLMSSLLTCPDALKSSDTLSIDFGAVANCHVRVAGAEYGSAIRSVYSKRLGNYWR